MRLLIVLINLSFFFAHSALAENPSSEEVQGSGQSASKASPSNRNQQKQNVDISSDSITWKESFSRAQELEKADQLEDAFLAASKALKLLEADATESENYLRVLDYLVNFCFTREQYSRAEQILRDGIAVIEKRAGNGSGAIGARLINLADILYAQERYGESIEIYQRAIGLLEQHDGSSADIASAFKNLASAYMHMRDLDKAEPAINRSLAIARRLYADEPIKLHPYLNNFASLLTYQGKYEEAEGIFREDLDAMVAEFGQEHPNIVPSLNNLADTFNQREQYKKALPFIEHGFNIRKKHLD